MVFYNYNFNLYQYYTTFQNSLSYIDSSISYTIRIIQYISNPYNNYHHLNIPKHLRLKLINISQFDHNFFPQKYFHIYHQS